jgi:integrase
MVCIGLSMGFRASDITGLCFENINWKQRSIRIIQQKTGKALLMPMPVKTGNVLFRYLRDGRPKSDEPFVFIRHKAPYGKLSIKTCTIALWSILPERKGVYGGFHVTRRTFATNILRNGAGAGRIMDALGHTDPTSVMKYLSMDEDRMRLCPLMLSDLSLNREEV